MWIFIKIRFTVTDLLPSRLMVHFGAKLASTHYMYLSR